MLIKETAFLIGCKPDTFDVVEEKRTLSKLLSIIDNLSEPLPLILDR